MTGVVPDIPGIPRKSTQAEMNPNPFLLQNSLPCLDKSTKKEEKLWFFDKHVASPDLHVTKQPRMRLGK